MAISTLVRGSFSNISLVNAVLPYNLNWLSRRWKLVHSFLDQHPLSLVDIGSRWARSDELEPLKKYVDCIAFDADAAEASRLEGEGSCGFRSFRVLPYFIGPRNGEETFYLFKERCLSSGLLPSNEYAKFNCPGFVVEQTVSVDSRTLDSVMESERVADIDIIKADTQGTEYDILTNSPDSLAKACLVEIEVEFLEMYKNQKLFSDVSAFMREKGFYLLYLNRAFVNRSGYDGPTRGQLVYGDALFGLSDSLAEQLPAAKKAKYVVLLILYGHMDFAYKLYRGDEAVRGLMPEAEQFFRFYSNSLWGKATRFALMQFDKVIALQLHARKTNQRGFETDRSWPTR
jgi:FkbM family methyltransferase